jgi:sigma-B regulation protein RsbU (phosphoserine phosphatase)
LGIFDELSLAEQVITLAPSDALVIYTDGLTDALNRQGEAYGLNRLVTATLSGPIGNASLLLSYLVADLDAFRQERPLFDDLTLLSLLGTFPDSATSSSQGEFTG